METKRCLEIQSALHGQPGACLLVLLLVYLCFCAPCLSAASLPAVRDRVITDPCLGIHWQLRPDPRHPGGPAHLVQVGQNEVTEFRTSSASEQPMVIRTGDTVVIDQDSAVLHARLLGIALASAGVGQSLPVRLNRVKGFEPGAGTATVTVIATGTRLAHWVVLQRSSR